MSLNLNNSAIMLDGFWQGDALAISYLSRYGRILGYTFNAGEKWNEHTSAISTLSDMFPMKWDIYHHDLTEGRVMSDVREITRMIGRVPTLKEAVTCTPFLYVSRQGARDGVRAILCRMTDDPVVGLLMSRSSTPFLQVNVPDSERGQLAVVQIVVVEELDDMEAHVAEAHLQLQATRHGKGKTCMEQVYTSIVG